MNADRLFSQLGQVGRVHSLSDNGRQYKVEFDGPDGVYLSGWLFALTSRAGGDRENWPYDIGEQVLVLALAPNLAVGVIVGALNQTAYPAVSANADERKTVYGDGTEVIYNRADNVLTINAVGDVKINTEGNVVLNDGAGVVTGECACHFTGLPHSDVSAVVFAGKDHAPE